MVRNAFWSSKYNHGKKGIFEKISANLVRGFRPRDEDVLGYWNCTKQQRTIMKNSDWSSNDAAKITRTKNRSSTKIFQVEALEFRLKAKSSKDLCVGRQRNILAQCLKGMYERQS